MKVNYRLQNGSEKEVLFGYVWDNHGWDKYIVAVDTAEKRKFTFNTFSGDICDYKIHDAIQSFARFLGITIPKGGMMPWTYKGKLGKLCHHDDFYEHYRKTFSLVPFSKTGLCY